MVEKAAEQAKPKGFLHFLVFENLAAELAVALLQIDDQKKEEIQEVEGENENSGNHLLFRGQTPLTLAVTLGHIECVKVLLASSSSSLGSVMVKNEAGYTPYQEAISRGNRDILKLIYLAKRKESALWINQKGKEILKDISSDMEDIVFEMNWSFASFIPFVSSLCPSDTYTIYKKGSLVRIDTTLVGFENLNWIRGNISILFRGEGDDPKLVIVDRDTRKFQQIWPREFLIDEAALEEDISVALNTPIHASPDINWQSSKLVRAKSGFYGFKYDKNEVIEEFPTRVWTISSVKMTFPVRREHLTANPLPEYVLREQRKADLETKKLASDKLEAEKKASPKPSPRFRIANPDTSDDEDEKKKNTTYTAEELQMEEKIKNYKPGYRHFSDSRDDLGDEWAEARKATSDFSAFRASLDPPPAPLISLEDYKASEEPVHLGRPMDVDNNEKTLGATLWMYEPQGHETDLDTLPINPTRLEPLLSMLGMGNEHIRSFQTFFKQSLPTGFPVQVDIPIGMLPISARIRFQAIRKGCEQEVSWFNIPDESDGYAPGEIITAD